MRAYFSRFLKISGSQLRSWILSRASIGTRLQASTRTHRRSSLRSQIHQSSKEVASSSKIRRRLQSTFKKAWSRIYPSRRKYTPPKMLVTEAPIALLRWWEWRTYSSTRDDPQPTKRPFTVTFNTKTMISRRETLSYHGATRISAGCRHFIDHLCLILRAFAVPVAGVASRDRPSRSHISTSRRMP